jgi:hypothetical protein
VKAQRLLAHRGDANLHPTMRVSHCSIIADHAVIEESIQYNAVELWKIRAPLSILVCVTDECLPGEERANSVEWRPTRRHLWNTTEHIHKQWKLDCPWIYEIVLVSRFVRAFRILFNTAMMPTKLVPSSSITVSSSTGPSRGVHVHHAASLFYLTSLLQRFYAWMQHSSSSQLQASPFFSGRQCCLYSAQNQIQESTQPQCDLGSSNRVESIFLFWSLLWSLQSVLRSKRGERYHGLPHASRSISYNL